MAETLVEEEQELRALIKTQVEGINRHYARMGSVAHLMWDDLSFVGRVLSGHGGASHESLVEASRKFNWVMHEMASARHSIDLERRDLADLQARLREVRAAWRAEREGK